MKLYLKEFVFNPLTKQINNLEQYCTKTTVQHQAFSSNGLFTIEEKQMFRHLISTPTSTSHANYLNKYTLIEDHSFLEKEIVHQLPSDAVVILTVIKQFKLTPQSKITFVIETFANDSPPIDYYFTFQNRLKQPVFSNQDEDIKHEINEFLSILSNI
jgi:phage terminase large subunit